MPIFNHVIIIIINIFIIIIIIINQYQFRPKKSNTSFWTFTAVQSSFIVLLIFNNSKA